MASPCDQSFLTAWKSQNSQNSYVAAQSSKGECPREPARRCAVFSGPASEVMQSPFHCIGLVISKSQAH